MDELETDRVHVSVSAACFGGLSFGGGRHNGVILRNLIDEEQQSQERQTVEQPL